MCNVRILCDSSLVVVYVERMDLKQENLKFEASKRVRLNDRSLLQYMVGIYFLARAALIIKLLRLLHTVRAEFQTGRSQEPPPIINMHELLDQKILSNEGDHY